MMTVSVMSEHTTRDRLRWDLCEQFMTEHDHFLVVSHVQPDGDAVGSTCAVGLILEHLGKQYVMMNEEGVPSKFQLLQGASSIQSLPSDGDKAKFKHVIAVDCADHTRIGRVSQCFAPDVHMVNIDHHATNNLYGNINIVDPTAASTTEVLFDLIQHMKIPLTLELATCIYTGLLTDTGGFRYANTSEKVMQIAAELIKQGVNANRLADLLLETLTIPHINLLKRALNRLEFAHQQQISWLSVTAEDIAACGASNADFEGIVNYPRNIEGVEVGLFFRQQTNEQVKVSFRSQGQVDVAQFAQTFGGGGHSLASGATIEGSLDEVIKRVISALEQEMQ